MNASVEETGPVERRLHVEIPTADVDAAFNKVFREVGRNAQIRGFRKGKAPRSVLEKFYGDRARGEVLERLVRETLFKAIEEQELDVLGQPELDPGDEPQQGAAFSYEARLEIRPKIELADLKGLRVKKAALPEAEEDQIQAHLDQLRERQAQLVEADEGTASAVGHVAVLDYAGSVDGEAFPGGTAEEAAIEIGSNRTIPGFEDNLVGLVIGDEREFQVTFPDDYPAAEVAGKEATFKVKLVGLKRRELPDLDDEFAKDVSEYETLAEFRAELQRRVDEGRVRDLERLQKDAAVDALIEANPFPVPPKLVEAQLHSRIQRALSQFGDQFPEERSRELVTTWTEEWRPQVERELRLALLVPEIAARHDLKVEDEDVERHLSEVAEREGRKLAEIKKTYREQGFLHALAGNLLEEKAVEFLMSEATLADT